jgi:hypothetical protein
MSKITFVAFLYLFEVIGLLLGGAELFSKVWFDFNAEKASMKSTDPVPARTAKYNRVSARGVEHPESAC